MKCFNCSKENNSGSKFCKYCGFPLGGDYKTCKNGHNYEAGLENCPYCPKSDYSETVVDYRPSGDKTIIDNSAPTLKVNNEPHIDTDRTVIIPKSSNIPANTESVSGRRKLVGWLVTYDLNSFGTDYRIFEGRTRIGRSNSNDIVISQLGISDLHSTILYRNGQFYLQDNLSTNGTFVNEVSIEDKITLHNDDTIRMGNINLKIKII